MVIKKNDAKSFEQPSIIGRKYDISESLCHNSFVYGELDREHGERISGNVPRLYYILEGKGRCEIAGEETEVTKGDLVIIPPRTKYNYWSKDGKIEFILYMEKH